MGDHACGVGCHRSPDQRGVMPAAPCGAGTDTGPNDAGNGRERHTGSHGRRGVDRRVVEPAVRDVNECSDLNVTWGQRKRGRKVAAIQFQFEPKHKPKKQVSQGKATGGAPKVEQASEPRPHMPDFTGVGQQKTEKADPKQAAEFLDQIKANVGMKRDE